MSRNFSSEFIDSLIVAIDRRRTEQRARDTLALAYREALRVLTPEQASEVIEPLSRNHVSDAQRKTYLNIRRDVPRAAATEGMAELLRAGFAEADREGRDQE